MPAQTPARVRYFFDVILMQTAFLGTAYPLSTDSDSTQTLTRPCRRSIVGCKTSWGASAIYFETTKAREQPRLCEVAQGAGSTAGNLAVVGNGDGSTRTLGQNQRTDLPKN